MAKKVGVVVYAVDGTLEWNALIKVGLASVNIPFRYGSFSGNSKTFAEHRTDDRYKQFVIENSSYFKNGKIRIEKDLRVEVEEPVSVSIEHPGLDELRSGDELVTGVAIDNEVTEVEVASLEDAKAYLIERFGLNASALRSKKSILSAATVNRIIFVGAEDLE